MSATAGPSAADRAPAGASAADRAPAGASAADRAPAGPSAADRAPAGRAAGERTLRIGEVAELTGTTPRTIRYYEEIGLLGADGSGERAQGKHRCYTDSDVDRIREIVRLRDLLGLSLEQLSSLLEAESARAHLRRELSQTESPADRRRILHELGGHIATQLELVRGRIGELQQLAAELEAKQVLVGERIAESEG